MRRIAAAVSLLKANLWPAAGIINAMLWMVSARIGMLTRFFRV
jgi:predicted anti-sigma-YlaC factor YlaD